MQYRRLMLLGTGGMATVHLALAAGPSGFNRLVVLKAMRDELMAVPDARAMFLYEARLCARLNHPNVVQVSEVVDSTSGVLLVMEYLDGRPLSAMYQAGDAFTLPMRLRVVCEVLAGLHYVHELRDFEGEPLGLVHRDVSPNNILVSFDGRVKLLDFGIAKVTSASEHTRTGIVKGKLTYMPAEQLRGQHVDGRSDIYSVGCILWEAIAGSRLWSKRPDKEIMERVLRGDIPPLSTRVQVDPRLERIVTRATALNPNDRYATAEEMRRELEQLLDEAAPTSTRDVGEFLCAAFADSRQRRSAEVAQLIAALPESTGGANVATEFQAAVTKSTATTGRKAVLWHKWPWALAALVVFGAAAFAVSPSWREPARFSPSSSSPDNIPQVALSVTVTPELAQLSIDGQPAGAGGALRHFATGSVHVVRAELPGYSPAERRVTLYNDTSMNIELSAQSAPAPSARPGAAPGSRSKPGAVSTRNYPVRAASNNAGPPKAAANCTPPYYFVGGIKTFKPECI